jgi:CheY-like chemotaxis protein
MTSYVLVVDDDAEIRSMIGKVLQLEAYEVVFAANGREALERIAQRAPSVVLLDLQMPVLTGWEVLQQLRAAGNGTPVIFMSAGGTTHKEATASGADGFLAKPFAIDDLLDNVAHVLS